MFIAHLPAGYLLHRCVGRRLPTAPLVTGSICPDFDIALIWLGLAHGHHHDFLTHRPAMWITCCLVATWLRSKALLALGLGAVLHVCLDSFAGRINWAWPFGDFTLGLISVPRQPGIWVWSFVNHPVFLIEITICTAAACLLWAKHMPIKKPRKTAGFFNR